MKSIFCETLFLLLVVITATATAQPELSNCGQKKNSLPCPSVLKGDQPFGSTINITAPGVARIIVKELLRKKPAGTFSEFRNISVNRDSLSFEYDDFFHNKLPTPHRPTFIFKELDYVYFDKNRSGTFVVSPLGSNELWAKVWHDGWVYFALLWKEESDARRFSEAFNRLIYEARIGARTADDIPTFSLNAKNWRDNSQSRSRPPEGWEKYRILAEQAIRDKDFIKAIENYEAGLQTFPMWPEGWFNAALLYEAVEEFESAADRMKHYLELMPDAPDAKAAREKIIIWEDKAKKPEE